MKFSKKAVLVFPIIITFFSCSGFFDREIPVSLKDHKNLIVINSILEEGQEILLFAITTSRSMKDTSSLLIPARDLDIELIVNSKKFLPVFFDSLNKFYYSQHKIVSGDKYELKVKSNQYPPVYCKTKIPKSAKILSARVGGKAYSAKGMQVREIFFTVEDIKNEENFYFLDLILTKQEWGHIDHSSTFSSPLLVFEKAQFNETLAFNDSFFKNSTVELMVWMSENEFQSFIRGQPDFYIRLQTVDKNMYDYYTQLHKHIKSRTVDIFAGEPINVPSNVNGGFGVLGSYSYYDFKLDYKEFLD